MNFFEHQDKARKQSRWLILVFILGVLAIVASINLVLLFALGVTTTESGEFQPFSAQTLSQNRSLLAGGSIGTVLVIGLASLFKTIKLQSGGGQVARELGGTLVESDTRDPLRRRLQNIVEEIALASGVPVPEIYVLEKESGINAFAAGYTPADAAIAVTQGTLEKLSRDELQGVIAHEFSHILNGDMRINIRLMGALFGILLLALIGRRVLIHTHFVGRSRDKNGGAILAIAIGVMAIGYLGQFFGRWIKAAISRQREYLADASAVQFTRDPGGIGGALKKIAVYSQGSYLEADTEEISHMLFGSGQKMNLFSTHPALPDRISRIDPSFQAEDLERLATRIVRDDEKQAQKLAAEREKASKEAQGKPQAGGADWFNPGNLIDQIGQPNWESVMMAVTVAASIPDNIRQAAQSAEWAPEVLFYTLLDPEEEIREHQLLLIAQRMGANSEMQVRGLMKAGQLASADQRLPLLELAFPALKRRPSDYVSRVLATVQELVELDGRIDVFEYLLARVISQHLWESQNPHRTKISGKLTLARCKPQARRVLGILATHGHESASEAQSAFNAGFNSLAVNGETTIPQIDDWVKALDSDLPKLDELSATEKQKLVAALITTVTHDGQTVASELELLRVICSLIHVPLPLMGAKTQQ